MANSISDVSFYDPALELQTVQRRRKLADALQAQGTAPSGGTEMVGGWAIPKSPWEGVGKIAQSLSGAYQNRQLDAREKEIGKENQTRLADVLSRATTAQMGTGATRTMQPTTTNDDEGNLMPVAQGQPAQGPDYSKAASIYMEHPATQAMGLQLQQKAIDDAKRKSFIAALAGGQGGAQTTGGMVPVGSNGAAPQSQTIRGVDNDLLAAMLSGDPEIIALAKAAQEGRKPVNVRPGGTVYEPGLGPTFTAPNGGSQITWQNGQPQMNNMSGALPAVAGQAAAQSAGTAYGRLPYALSTQNTEGAPTLNTDFNWINQATGKPPVLPMGMGGPVGPQVPQQPQGAPAPQGGPIPTSAVVPQNQAGDQQANLAAIDAEIKRPGQTPANIAILQRERQSITGQQPVPANQPGGGLRLQDQGESAQQKKYGEERGQILAAQPQAQRNLENVNIGIDNSIKKVDELLGSKDLWKVTGPLFGRMGSMSGGGVNAEAKIETLKSQIGVQVLTAMREASKTGGAVGAVTEKEWPILEAQLGSLQTKQTEPEFKKGLADVRETMERIRKNAKDAYANTYPQAGVTAPAPQRRATDKRTQIIPAQGMSANNVMQQADAILNGNR